MNTETLKGSGVYAHLERDQPSGIVRDDYVPDALKVYHAETKSDFKHIAAWKVLHKAPKWKVPKNAVPTLDAPFTPPISSDIDIASDSLVPTPSQRSLGGKKTKSLCLAKEEDEATEINRREDIARATQVEARRVDALEEGNFLAKRALLNEEREKDFEVANANLDDCKNDLAREILKRMKEELKEKYNIPKE